MSAAAAHLRGLDAPGSTTIQVVVPGALREMSPAEAKELKAQAGFDQGILNPFGLQDADGRAYLDTIKVDGEKNRTSKSTFTGIDLTESYAMNPPASVSGLYFAHPQAKYFVA